MVFLVPCTSIPSINPIQQYIIATHPILSNDDKHYCPSTDHHKSNSRLLNPRIPGEWVWINSIIPFHPISGREDTLAVESRFLCLNSFLLSARAFDTSRRVDGPVLFNSTIMIQYRVCAIFRWDFPVHPSRVFARWIVSPTLIQRQGVNRAY